MYNKPHDKEIELKSRISKVTQVQGVLSWQFDF